MSDNPFDEPTDAKPARGESARQDPPDNERTMIRPMPGGRVRRTEAAAQPTAEPRRLDRDGPPLPIIGASPLLAAAAPLLQLMGRLRSLAGDPDPASLRDLANQELTRFAAATQRLSLPADDARTAHYILCASLDDVVMNTGWGRTGAWAQNSLVAVNHRNVVAGEGFFQRLEERQRDPANHQELLSLMYICLSLGFQGRYRVLPRGTNDLEALRARLYDTLKTLAASAERALSPRWRGEDAPYAPARARLPAWVVGAGVLAFLAGLFLLLSILLGGSADIAFGNANASAPAMPVIQRPEVRREPTPQQPPPPGPSAAETMRRFLEPEIRAGLVSVTETAATTTVRIRASGMFGSGSASLQPTFLSLLQRIGDALNTEPGQVQVVGHSDNQPIRTVRFPSNYQLSLARAQSARDIVAQKINEPARLSVEGRADQVPVASNDTAEGREANRRIEIVLRRQGQ